MDLLCYKSSCPFPQGPRGKETDGLAATGAHKGHGHGGLLSPKALDLLPGLQPAAEGHDSADVLWAKVHASRCTRSHLELISMHVRIEHNVHVNHPAFSLFAEAGVVASASMVPFNLTSFKVQAGASCLWHLHVEPECYVKTPSRGVAMGIL